MTQLRQITGGETVRRDVDLSQVEKGRQTLQAGKEVAVQVESLHAPMMMMIEGLMFIDPQQLQGA